MTLLDLIEMIDWLIASLLADCLEGQLIGWLAAWLTAILLDRSINRVVDWLGWIGWTDHDRYMNGLIDWSSWSTDLLNKLIGRNIDWCNLSVPLFVKRLIYCLIDN